MTGCVLEQKSLDYGHIRLGLQKTTKPDNSLLLQHDHTTPAISAGLDTGHCLVQQNGDTRNITDLTQPAGDKKRQSSRPSKR